MERVDLDFARENLEDLIARANRGEDVRIRSVAAGSVRLMPEAAILDWKTKRVSDVLPPFVPLTEPRKLGHLEGKIPPPPEGIFDPMTEEELKDWYGGEE